MLKTGRTGVVFINMGGPHSLDQVHPFLLNLFSDKDLIPLPAQKFLSPWFAFQLFSKQFRIAKRRTPSIIEQYRKIGGGSPIRKWTQTQADAVCKMLDTSNPETGMWFILI